MKVRGEEWNKPLGVECGGQCGAAVAQIPAWHSLPAINRLNNENHIVRTFVNVTSLYVRFDSPSFK